MQRKYIHIIYSKIDHKTQCFFYLPQVTLFNLRGYKMSILPFVISEHSSIHTLYITTFVHV